MAICLLIIRLIECDYTPVSSANVYAQDCIAVKCIDALTKLFLKLLEVLWHWFALCLELLDFACHALHVQELCNAVINLQMRNIQSN